MDAKIETTGNEQMEHEQRARTADFIERARVKALPVQSSLAVWKPDNTMVPCGIIGERAGEILRKDHRI